MTTALHTTPAHQAARPDSLPPRALRWLLMLGLLATLTAVPWFTGFATQRLLVEVFTVFAIATAWNLLAGFGGLVVIGQHAFVGVGAYALFWLSNNLGLNPWWTLPLAAVAAVGADRKLSHF